MKLFTFCLFFSSLLNSFSHASEKIVVDTDAGSDDAIALLILLRAESLRRSRANNFEIVAITCSYGNTRESNVETNIIKTLTIANRTDIPVYTGAKNPLINKFKTDNFFGKDGFGDIDFKYKVTKTINRTPASTALIDFSKIYNGNLTVIMLAPTTNVALAIMLDENFVKRVKKFYACGSSIAGMGNAASNKEFNFYADPESNAIFLRSATSSQMTLFPWETGLNVGLSMHWRLEVLGNVNSPYRDFINQIEKISLENLSIYTPTDPATVATFLEPETITFSSLVYARAIVSGDMRGGISVNYMKVKSSNIRLILAVNKEAIKVKLEKGVNLFISIYLFPTSETNY